MRREGAKINLRRGDFCLKNVCVPLKHSLADDVKVIKEMNNFSDDLRLLSREDLGSS